MCKVQDVLFGTTQSKALGKSFYNEFDGRHKLPSLLLTSVPSFELVPKTFCFE